MSTFRRKLCTSILVIVVLISQSTILFADTQKSKLSVVKVQQEEGPAIPDDSHNEENPDPNAEGLESEGADPDTESSLETAEEVAEEDVPTIPEDEIEISSDPDREELLETPYPFLKAMTLLAGQHVYEFENIYTGSHSGARLTFVKEDVSSGGRHAFYESNATGDWIEFSFEAEEGIYQLDLRIKQFKNRGISQIYINGSAVGQPLDFYNLTARHIDTEIGQIILDDRLTHTIRFEVIDKNPDSTSYILGLDAMYLTNQETLPVLDAPTNLKTGIQSDTTVNLEWSPSANSSGATIESYEIFVNDVLSAAVPAAKNQYTVVNLTPGTSYAFKVRAKSHGGDYSEFSSTIQIETLSGVYVYEFESLEGATHSGDRLSRIEENVSSAGKHVFYESNAAGDWIEFPFAAEAGIYQLDLRVKQFNNRGVSQIYVDGIAIGQPLDLYNPSARHIHTQVGQITLDNRAGHTIRFEIMDKNSASSNYILGLDAMYLTKQAQPTAPQAPSNLISDIQSDTTINLEWTAPVQDPGIVIESYEIYQDDALAATVAGTKTFHTLTGLTPGTEYSYKIRALSEHQLASEFSESIVVSTLSGKLIYEFEQLPGITHSGDKLSMLEESKSSAGLHAFYESNATGDWIEMPFTAEKGTYQLDMRIKQFNNRGISQVYVNGSAIGQPIDFYNQSARHIDTQVGQIALDQRPTHTIRFQLTGKNSASTNYILGLDAMYLTPVNIDTFEPNDTPETATAVNVLQTYESYISSKTDVDFYKFTALEGDTYFLTLQSPSDHEYKLEILNANKQPVSTLRQTQGGDEEVSVYLAKNAFIYIKVTSLNGDFSFEPYRFRITPAPTKQYVYDDANRLTRTEYVQGLYRYQIQYEYDRNGNLLKKKVVRTIITP
ncbi:fibronectin type III domain-containing protein [Paenibacillus bouchesdurhonensis]|uniref:fibronectin type III domain-containing protein n=1 Tax=Paenibacillus bouchesdurhonensis TaxID=1870990 RepID=UPI001F36D042|nr:fibronectin type III domain-containing protein [Paenibacillus bouchesdurhonensis]